MDTQQLLGPVDLTNDQYHGAPGISKSHLDTIAQKSPRHYWYKYLNPNREPEPKSRPFLFGQAAHTAILEPETMAKRVIVGLAHDRRSKANQQAWAEFELEHWNKVIITREEMDAVERIVENVWSDSEIAGLLTGGVAEQSFFAMMDVPDGEGGVLIDHDTGEIIQELVKCQCDYRKRGSHIIDLKSTLDASPEAFAKSMANYRYPVQQSWYKDVLRAGDDYFDEPFGFLCFEKDEPNVVALHFIDEFDEAKGRIAHERDFNRIVTHRRAGLTRECWPTYFTSIADSVTNPLILPRWMKL